MAAAGPGASLTRVAGRTGRKGSTPVRTAAKPSGCSPTSSATWSSTRGTAAATARRRSPRPLRCATTARPTRTLRGLRSGRGPTSAPPAARCSGTLRGDSLTALRTRVCARRPNLGPVRAVLPHRRLPGGARARALGRAALRMLVRQGVRAPLQPAGPPRVAHARAAARVRAARLRPQLPVPQAARPAPAAVRRGRRT